MDCSQFQEVLADLDRPGVLTAELREQALAHTEGCAECGQLLTETESLDWELRRLREREANAVPTAQVEAQLLLAFQRRKAGVARQTTRRYAAVIGIAATLLLAVGLWMYRRSVDSTQTRIAKDAGGQVATPRKIEANNARLSPEAALHRGATAELARGTASSTPKQLASEDASAFIPLPDADYPISLDDGAVVRVVMPRATLASFGLPVEAMEGDGTVRADLIVSADGTPQAIRLVSQDDASGAAQR
ncbi:MAG: hypothetical protein ACRD4X_02955 [Candidatus Acidiferrales bacterium]